MLNVLSLGAGVQSSVLALMASRGEIEAPDCAIFADTGAEPASVYRWLDWLEDRLTFPLHRVSKGSLEADEGRIRTSSRSGYDYVTVSAPYWAFDGENAGGPLGRKCTRDYKISCVQREMRKILGIHGKRSPAKPVAASWLGISTDEAHRMKPSRETWVENRYPLIDMRMSREDCLAWARAAGIPEPPRSACVFCPFHNADEWRRLQVDEPVEYERACAHEDRMREAWRTVRARNPHPNMAADLFLQKHVPGVPLREIDWVELIERGDDQLDMFSMWGNECEGLCGV